MSRKDSRKLERAESKKRKAERQTTKQRQQQKRPAQKEHRDVPAAKRPKVSAPPSEAKASKLKPKKKTPLQKLVGNPSGYSREGKEDAYIRYLEDKLGWKESGTKTSAYGSGLADDGLDGCACPSLLFRPVQLIISSTELLADLDTFESSTVRKGFDENIGSN